MITVILMIHVLIIVTMLIVILLQRSEGGGIGMGTSSNSFMGSLSTADFLTRITAILAVLFFVTSIMLSFFYKEVAIEKRSILESQEIELVEEIIEPKKLKYPYLNIH